MKADTKKKVKQVSFIAGISLLTLAAFNTIANRVKNPTVQKAAGVVRSGL